MIALLFLAAVSVLWALADVVVSACLTRLGVGLHWVLAGRRGARRGVVAGTLVLGVLGCGNVGVDTAETDCETETSSTDEVPDEVPGDGCAVMFPVDQCPEAVDQQPDLEGRCAKVFPGSVPCLWRPGECGGDCKYPPTNAANVSTLTCGGELAELWCCK